MNCAWVQERLLLHLAGELDPQQRDGIDRHLERCTRCAAMAEGLAETQERLETALPTAVEAPLSLDTRVMEAVRRLPPPRPSRRLVFPRMAMGQRFGLVSTALCLMLASFAAGNWYGARKQPGLVVAAPTLDLGVLGGAHLQYLAAETVGQTDAPNPQLVAGTLSTQLPFPVGVVELRPDGMRLLSGSKATVNGVPVAALRYKWKGERISLFQMDARALSPRELRQVVVPPDSYFVKKTGGLTYVTWSFGGTKCVMVAHAVPMHLLFQLACHTSEKLERT